MEKKVIKVILLQTNQTLISEIEEVAADIGQPDCKLINPMEICESTLFLHGCLNRQTRCFYD